MEFFRFTGKLIEVHIECTRFVLNSYMCNLKSQREDMLLRAACELLGFIFNKLLRLALMLPSVRSLYLSWVGLCRSKPFRRRINYQNSTHKDLYLAYTWR